MIEQADPNIKRVELMGYQIQPEERTLQFQIRNKFIFAGDTNINRAALYTFASQIVTPRNPFAQDPSINYDLDTEEEFEELVNNKGFIRL